MNSYEFEAMGWDAFAALKKTTARFVESETLPHQVCLSYGTTKNLIPLAAKHLRYLK